MDRFLINDNTVEDSLGVIPLTVWGSPEQQQKFCNELNDLYNRLDETLETNSKLASELQDALSKIIELKKDIKILRIDVIDAIKDSESVQCCCSPCQVEEYVKKVVE